MLIISTGSFAVECDRGEYFERDIPVRYQDYTTQCPKCGKPWTHKAWVPPTEAELFEALSGDDDDD